MRERVKRLFSDFARALSNLKDAITNAQDELDIDGTIKRFELCYELCWKFIKVYLEDEGIICKGPRDCFKQAVINGLLDDEIKWMEMIDDRNFLVHTYSSEESREVFNKIKESYLDLFQKLSTKIIEEESL